MEEEVKQSTTAKSRKRTKTEPKEETKTRSRRPMAEFAVEPHDHQLIEDLQAHLASHVGERRQRARILRTSTHHGLLVEIILAGPDKNGLYAGRYTGKELAEMTRQLALLLSDLQARYSTPIFQAGAVWPTMAMPVPEATSSNGSVKATTEANIDQKGAVALKGLGVSSMKRRSDAPPPPE